MNRSWYRSGLIVLFALEGLAHDGSPPQQSGPRQRAVNYDAVSSTINDEQATQLIATYCLACHRPGGEGEEYDFTGNRFLSDKHLLKEMISHTGRPDDGRKPMPPKDFAMRKEFIDSGDREKLIVWLKAKFNEL